MDSKYGRIYTDADIRKLGEKLLGNRAMGPDILAEALDELESEFTIPADEPTFCLRANDLAATVVFAPYAAEAKKIGASQEFIDGVMRSYDAMMKFVHEHRRTRVKVPD